jgi:hypothetical protein
MPCSPVKGFVLAVVLCLIAAPVLARQVQLIGAGSTASCGGWLDARRADKNIESMMATWAVGYLSGVAEWTETEDPLNNTDFKGVEYWLDNYCNAHAAEKFSHALNAFVTERHNQ